MLALVALLFLAPAGAASDAATDTVFVDAPEIVGTWEFAATRRAANGVAPPTQFPGRVTYGADGVVRFTSLWDGTTEEARYRVADIDGRRVLLTDQPWDWQGTPFKIEGEQLVLMHPPRVSPPGPGGVIRCGTPSAPAFDAVWRRTR